MESLTELALDLHWAWNHSADELWALRDHPEARTPLEAAHILWQR